MALGLPFKTHKSYSLLSLLNDNKGLIMYKVCILSWSGCERQKSSCWMTINPAISYFF